MQFFEKVIDFRFEVTASLKHTETQHPMGILRFGYHLENSCLEAFSDVRRAACEIPSLSKRVINFVLLLWSHVIKKPPQFYCWTPRPQPRCRDLPFTKTRWLINTSTSRINTYSSIYKRLHPCCCETWSGFGFMLSWIHEWNFNYCNTSF